MGFFEGPFKKQVSPSARVNPPHPERSTEDLRKDPNLIRVFDKYGQELFITRKDWVDNVLTGNLKNAWNHPDKLYDFICEAMHDGFFDEVVKASEQLHRIDASSARSAIVLGIVYMKTGQLKAAERILKTYIAKRGDDGCVLTNLAKVYAEQNNHALAEKTLWRALEVDPNQDNGMGWYEVIHRERGGEKASLEALQRIASLPKSWRAQLWLARATLASKNLQRALEYYTESLSRAGTPISVDLLMQMSGDLGNSGHLDQIIKLVQPRFDASLHGLQVGNNLIKAHFDLGNRDAARKILDQLYALKRPDWRDTLSFWDTELAKAHLSKKLIGATAKLQVSLLTVDGPVWLKPDSPATSLFPVESNSTVTISFLGSTADVATNSKRIQHQMADGPGRMSRALPLFLAEQVHFSSFARVQTLVPWIDGEPSGFVLGGTPWTDEYAARYAREGTVKNDYVVVIHLNPTAEPWQVELRLIRTIDATCLGTLHTSFPSSEPEKGIPELILLLRRLLYEQTGVEPIPESPLYKVPEGPSFALYLLRLEQLLAVRCSSVGGGLSGEREIIDGNIQLCLKFPENVVTRLVLVQTLIAFKRVRPDILAEFKDKASLLQKEHPLPQLTHDVLHRLFNEAFTTTATDDVS
jgi:tetratricopeptide (TPR) repeat protein